MSDINYWICTERLRHGGKKVIGPFSTRSLAVKVRELLEYKNKPITYWLDTESVGRKPAPTTNNTEGK